MNPLKHVIRQYLSDGRDHTPEEIKTLIIQHLGDVSFPGELNLIYAELLRDTINEFGGKTPDGRTFRIVKLKE